MIQNFKQFIVKIINFISKNYHKEESNMEIFTIDYTGRYWAEKIARRLVEQSKGEVFDKLRFK